MAQHNELGKQGETMAVDYLKKQGYTIVDVDWRYGHCDIDIVALTPDGLTTVFVEVKTRSDDDWSQPWEAVDRKKIRHIANSANNYVKLNGVENELRFDIVSIVGTTPANMQIEHIDDAYNPLQMM